MYCTVLYCTVLYCTVLYCNVIVPDQLARPARLTKEQRTATARQTFPTTWFATER